MSIKAFWLQIHYGHRSEVCVYFGPDLRAVLDSIDAAQKGRLAYLPTCPRITRIAAVAPVTLDRAFTRMIDNVLALENTARHSNV